MTSIQCRDSVGTKTGQGHVCPAHVRRRPRGRYRIQRVAPKEPVGGMR